MKKFDNLLPTPRLTGAVDQKAALQEEVLAYRILLASAVWKAGGSIKLSNAELSYVAMNCKLDQSPTAEGQIITVCNPDIQDTPIPSKLLLPGDH